MFNRYLHNAIFSSFVSFFTPLFGIASLIFFIKIVSVTAIIKINIFELFQMYLFILPQILFFILPVTFFAAGVAALHRLSFEYEITALFTLGFSPTKIVKSLLGLSLLFSTFALLFSLILIPQAKQVYKGFIVYKKSEAKLNIKPSEFGHKFGDWYLFLGKKVNNFYTNVALYNNKLQNQENFIVASKARLINDQKGLKLLLHDGSAYTYQKDGLKEIRFQKMEIVSTSSAGYFRYLNPIEYWFIALSDKKRAFDLSLFLLISLFPIASIFFIPAIAIHNPRFSHPNPFLISLALIALFFGLAYAAAKALLLGSFVLLPLWMAGGWFYFKNYVLRRY